jgi:hypothetical protein
MSLQQSKILLDKINSLYQNITIDGEISSIERDLMLSYVRQFYEAILEASEGKIVIPPPPPAPKAIPMEVVAPKVEIPTPVAPPPPPVVEPIPVAVIEPKVESKIEPIVEPKVEIIAPPPLPITPKIEERIIVPPVVEIVPPVAELPPTPKPLIEKPSIKSSQKPLIKPLVEAVGQEELFEEKMSKELSDKLGELPIADIRKGMGLNERIIFLNELFEGNAPAFDNAINTLNNAADFNAAQAELKTLFGRYGWALKEKHAKAFIRLVKRRHS